MIFLGWTLMAAVAAPIGLGVLSLASPGTFSRIVGIPGREPAPLAPRYVPTQPEAAPVRASAPRPIAAACIGSAACR